MAGVIQLRDETGVIAEILVRDETGVVAEILVRDETGVWLKCCWELRH